METYAWHGMMPAGPSPLCAAFRSSLSSCVRGHSGGVDTGLGSNSREAVEDVRGKGRLSDDFEEWSIDCMILIHMRLIDAPTHPNLWFWDITVAFNDPFLKILETAFHFLF